MKRRSCRPAIGALRLWAGVGLALEAIAWSGCRSTPVFTVPPTTGVAECVTPARDPDLLVGLAVSGGGSRAALFAAGAFEALSHVRIGPERRSLLEQVSYISSVSGGSLASAYFVLKKPARETPVLAPSGDLSDEYQRFFADFKNAMAVDYEGPLLWRQLTRLRWFNPSWTARSLSEILSEDYFGSANFTELAAREARGDSPRLMVNTTLYNDGRRFVLSTLPRDDVQYDLVEDLRKAYPLSEESQETIRVRWESLTTMVPQDLAVNICPVKVSGAVAASMSFPPVIGPMSLGVKSQDRYWHVGDGGLSDNTGGESLLMLFLKKLQERSTHRALIFMIDSSFPFSVGGEELDHREEGFSLFNYDYSRIPSIMEERSLAYRALFLTIGQQIGIIPPPERIRVVRIRHTDAKWKEDLSDLPESCRKAKPQWKSPKEVAKHLSGIVTRLWLESGCDRDLIAAAAGKVVADNEKHIISFVGQ